MKLFSMRYPAGGHNRHTSNTSKLSCNPTGQPFISLRGRKMSKTIYEGVIKLSDKKKQSDSNHAGHIRKSALVKAASTANTETNCTGKCRRKM